MRDSPTQSMAIATGSLPLVMKQTSPSMKGQIRPKTDFPPIRACIFDLDGTLIDSEEHYVSCANEILSRFGKPDLTWAVRSQMQAGPHAHQVFHDWAQLPITVAEYNAELSKALRKYFPSSQPLEGVENLLRQLSAATSKADGGKIHLALATSSHGEMFASKTGHLKMFEVFTSRYRILGDDPRLPKGKGKPCPDIYLLALQAINDTLPKGVRKVELDECLVFEDSVSGVEAGRRAGMRCVWIPHPDLVNEYKGMEKEILAGKMGLARGNADKWVQAGKVDDGWAEKLVNLVDFSFEKYKINQGRASKGTRRISITVRTHA